MCHEGRALKVATIFLLVFDVSGGVLWFSRLYKVTYHGNGCWSLVGRKNPFLVASIGCGGPVQAAGLWVVVYTDRMDTSTGLFGIVELFVQFSKILEHFQESENNASVKSLNQLT